MNVLEEMQRRQKVMEMLTYMSQEVCNNMQKIVLLATSEEDKYAIKSSVNEKNLEITFSLFNSSTSKIASKTYTSMNFARICSTKEMMELTFNNLAYDMLESVDK